VLAFDTATSATAVALAAEGGSGWEARDDPPPGARPGHARRLLSLVEEVLAPAGGWRAVDRLAVGVGPGTFTGLRIGLATAHSLARARGLPLVGVSTLTALAVEARAAAPQQPLLALIDARRGEAFAAAWTAGADPVRDGPAVVPRVVAPAALGALAERFPGGLAVGDGAVKFRSILEDGGIVVPADGDRLNRVSARAHCRLAARLSAGRADSVQPTYLRRPDAEIAKGP
jgi:tRNA threonylcarbamoyladenosine biosynthesis protein TsaB